MKLTCKACGAKVGWYRGGEVNKTPTRLCEHKDPNTGRKCHNSNRPIGGAAAEYRK